MLALRALLLIVTFSMLGGCAIGQRIDYRDATPTLAVRSTTPIQVSVIDERPYVRSGSKKANYVGTLRALYYNPFNVTTLSGTSLASDMNDAIRTSLARAAIPAETSYASEAAPGKKLLMLRVREWKSDTYMRTRFDYDITASVLDEHGSVLASKHAQQSGQISHFIIAGSAALDAVLNDRSIVDALSATPTTTAFAVPASTAPTTTGTAATANRYDDCMRRVARINDPALRLASMSTCDQVK